MIIRKLSFSFFIICLLFLISFLPSCIVVKEEIKEEEEFLPSIIISPKPEIEMSDVVVRSKKGDMISMIPKDWFFIDVEDKASSDIIAVAVNPDYTLAAVFSTLRKNEFVDDVFAKEGLLGLARLSFEHHFNKTAGAVKLIDKYKEIDIGLLKFGFFQYFATNTNLKSRNAVFKSDFDNYYEFALIQMDITGKPIPKENEIEKIFNSILATIQY